MIVAVAEDLALQGEPISTIGSDAKEKSLKYAETICRSLPYCFNEKKGTLGKLISMVPFDAAWHVFVIGKKDADLAGNYGREVDFYRSTVLRYQQMGIMLFRER